MGREIDVASFVVVQGALKRSTCGSGGLCTRVWVGLSGREGRQC